MEYNIYNRYSLLLQILASSIKCFPQAPFNTDIFIFWDPNHVCLLFLSDNMYWIPNGCLWTVVLEKTLESPLDCKEIQPNYPKGNQSWIFIGRTDVEAETPILWPPNVKNWLIWKDPDVGKDWKQEEKGNDRGWDGWMVSPTRWTWVWVSSGSWWWTGKPGMVQSMGLQRVGHNWANELNWTCGSDSKESAHNVGDLDLISESGRYPIKGNGNPIQYSCLENPTDGEGWRATFHGVVIIWTSLSD